MKACNSMLRLALAPVLFFSISAVLFPTEADQPTAPEKTASAKSNHWAFRPPQRPQVPNAANQSWVRNSIDNFVLARLEKEALAPSAEADEATLLRRLNLDLIGLPPTPAELDAFLNDASNDAYEQQVERLLRSPHYGERWGRHWLDAARYADSDGYEKDKSRRIWFYRDWVVDSFNRDLPYDQFVIEQIAGDLLPNATQDQIVATGFLRNSMVNEEGGIDPEQFRMEAMFDRMDAIGKSILGLTIQCAQCHDHKFDPLKQEEYFRMFAFINDDHEAEPIVYTAEEQNRVADLKRRMREFEASIQQAAPDWQQRMAAWEDSVKDTQPEWAVLSPVQTSEADTRFFEQPDGSLLGLGYAPTKFTFVFQATNHSPVIKAFRLELLTDPNLPAGGPGRSFKGTCALTEFRVESADASNRTNKVAVKLVKATADYANEERELESNFDDRSGKRRVTGAVELAIDEKDETAWGIDAGAGRRNQDRKAVFVASTNVAFPSGTILTFYLKNNHGGWNSDDHQNNNIGRFRLSVSSSDRATADPLPSRVREILEIAREKRSSDERAELFSYWRTTVPEFKNANEKIEELWRSWPVGSTTLALRAREVARETHILKRGDWLKPEKTVGAGVPSFLHPLPDSDHASNGARLSSGAATSLRPSPFVSSNAPLPISIAAPEDGRAPLNRTGRELPARLTFARWLADRRSPTTARVFMNRVWQAYFGVGLVSTPEDFGLQSEAPSHPALLDWLACEFMDRGWSLKQMHRLIVTSATYRQSSRVTPELYARDQFNRLLARGPRFRIEGEIVRDVALAVSGLLNPKIGGRSVMPPAPAFLFMPPASYAPFPWTEETGAERYRRGLYTFRRRSTPYPVLQAFDVPNADFSCVRRSRSNTPLQALTTLNETLFMESAQALAMRTLHEGGKTDSDRLAYAFRLCVSRKPTRDEQQELLQFLGKQQRRISEGWISAWSLGVPNPERPPKLPEETTPTQLAAWTAVSRVLLNLDETMTKE